MSAEGGGNVWPNADKEEGWIDFYYIFCGRLLLMTPKNVFQAVCKGFLES